MKIIAVIYLILGGSLNLSAQEVFTNFNDALKNPLKVFSLEISCWSNDCIIPDNRISELKNLEYLRIYHVKSDSLILPTELICLAKLRKLSIDGEHLKAIPPVVYKLIKLEELGFFSNGLISFTDDIANLTNLTSLSIRSDSINEIPHALFDLTNLKEVYLKFPGVETLSIDLGNLTQLISLRLYLSEKVILPDVFDKLATLEFLDIWKTKTIPNTVNKGLTLKYFRQVGADTIPDFICEWKSLNKLVLDQGIYSTIPSCIGDLQKLEELQLSSGKLHSLPKSIVQLKNLKSLELINTSVSELDPQLNDLPNLRWIIVRGSKSFDFSKYKNIYGDKLSD